MFPSEAHAVEGARSEVFDQHVGVADEPFENSLAFRRLGIEGQRPFIAIQHRKVERVEIRHVAQLIARNVSDAGPFHFQDIGAEPGQQLRARR